MVNEHEPITFGFNPEGKLPEQSISPDDLAGFCEHMQGYENYMRENVTDFPLTKAAAINFLDDFQGIKFNKAMLFIDVLLRNRVLIFPRNEEKKDVLSDKSEKFTGTCHSLLWVG